MIKPASLNELEQDAITEMFNIGICKAASSLSEMVQKEVLLSVPQLSIATIAQAKENISDSLGEVSGVLEAFDGSVAGNALLLFPQEKTLELIKLLFPGPMDDEMLQEMEGDALTEIGNIILNASLSSLAEIIGEELSNQIPETFKGHAGDVILSGDLEDPDQYVLQMDMSLTVKEIDVIGNVSFLIIIKSIDQFKEKLTEYFQLPSL